MKTVRPLNAWAPRTLLHFLSPKQSHGQATITGGTRDSRRGMHVQEWEELLAAKFPGGLYACRPWKRVELHHSNLLFCQPSKPF